VKNLKKYKKVVGLLLVVVLAIVWISLPNLWFHVFFAIALSIALGVLSGFLYLLNVQDNKIVKTYQMGQIVEEHSNIDRWNKEKSVVIPMEHNIKNY
jgi:hypothetical protein